MFCKKCGKEISDSSKYCPNCGQKVNDVVSDTNGEQKNVKLVLHRRKSCYGAAVSIKVFIDGNLVGSVKSNGTATVNVAPGNHEIVFDMWTATNKEILTVPADCSTVYAEFSIKIGLLTNKVKITSIRNEK